MMINREQGNFSAFIFISYDFTNERQRFDVYGDADGKNFTVSVLQRYDQGLEYEFDADNTFCKTQKISNMQQACVPPYSERQFQYTIGGALPVTSYFYDQANVNFTMFTVDQANCFPIGGNFFEDGRWAGEASYWNQIQGIQNPNIFNVPSHCS
eukprot:TRINITY_DN3352_c0_g4_i1.p1 TRINITY_DN3352_c0_g4~~TRINITY_DN3352_c0_g4_i1.p1  ORF type:complete len:154 (-),score=39.78 TRINITY_DN3352_c0_g4_i1:172-633(-)